VQVRGQGAREGRTGRTQGGTRGQRRPVAGRDGGRATGTVGPGTRTGGGEAGTRESAAGGVRGAAPEEAERRRRRVSGAARRTVRQYRSTNLIQYAYIHIYIYTVTTTVGDFRVGGQGGRVGGEQASRRGAARSVRTAVARARRTVHGVRGERDRGEENGRRTDRTANQNDQSKYG